MKKKKIYIYIYICKFVFILGFKKIISIKNLIVNNEFDDKIYQAYIV